MKTKYFYPNLEGNIEFTREELEKLLNDVFDEGRAEGLREARPYLQYVEVPIEPYSPYPYTPIIYNTPKTPEWDWTKVYCTDDNSIGRTVIEWDKPITTSTLTGDYKINVTGNNE